MSRHLYLLRHAKSDWDAEHGDDHDRPLSRRGKGAAALVGRWIAELGEPPDAALSSTALRARDTVERAMAAGGWSCPVELSRRLYLTSPAEVLAEIRRTADSVRRLLVTGHQPVWAELIGILIGEEDRGARLKFPTAALARVDFEEERWRDVGSGRGALKWLVTPKALGSATALEAE
jgi:phosphohistidine phosphatase